MSLNYRTKENYERIEELMMDRDSDDQIFELICKYDESFTDECNDLSERLTGNLSDDELIAHDMQLNRLFEKFIKKHRF